MRLKAIIASLAALLTLTAALPVEADVYKWIDGQGVTHYSQLPPLNRSYTVIQTRGDETLPSTPAAPPNAPQTPDTTQQAPKQVDRNEIPDLKQRCQIARKDVLTLEKPERIRIVKPDGSVEWMDDAQRAQHLKEAKSFIAKYCSSD